MSEAHQKFTLFLLHPGFDDGTGGDFFCPDCALVEGFLRYNPAIEAHLDVQRIAFPRPRSRVIAALGEAHQGCPVLILPQESVGTEAVQRSTQTGRLFVADGRPICDFLAQTFGVSRPH